MKLLGPYKVRVRWVAQADVEVEAEDAFQAVELAASLGLPWNDATEADDGSSTSFTVLDPAIHGGK